MGPTRLEAFSDGVIAIIITIMVLELHVPHAAPGAADLGALRPLLPVFASYVLSFVVVAIFWVAHHSEFHYIRHSDRRHLWINLALLLTLVLLFGLQGEQIVRQPVVILLLAVPILIQVYLNAGLAYWLNRRLGVAWCVAGPSALIGASNFFALAVAAAIALFGFQSGAALATVVGVLVEVPVMLSVVRIVRASRGWYERGAAG